MLSKAAYLSDPCGTSSLPYWKSAALSVPENMLIVHDRNFTPDLLAEYADMPYFRLKHDLRAVSPAVLPDGFHLSDASPAEFASHIGECYGFGMSAGELDSYRDHSVYCPDLWIAVRDHRSGRLVASGIAELDREIGEGMLEWIQVSPGFRRRGLGAYVVNGLLRRLQGRAAFATVSGQLNNPSDPKALYEKCGFTGGDVWHILRK